MLLSKQQHERQYPSNSKVLKLNLGDHYEDFLLGRR